MNKNKQRAFQLIDLPILLYYLLLTSIGILSIYSSVYTEGLSLFSLEHRGGSQLLWFSICIGVAAVICLLVNTKIYTILNWWFYFAVILLLIAVLIFGTEVSGSKSWLQIGSIRLQPAEISKITTSLCIASIMSSYGFKISKVSNFLQVVLTIVIPSLLILLEPEWGSVLVYTGFIFVLYREGLNGWIIVFLISTIFLFILTLVFSPLISLLVLIGFIGVLIALFSQKVLLITLCFSSFIALASFTPKLLKLDFMYFFSRIPPEYFLAIISIPFLIFYLIKGLKKEFSYFKYITLCYAISAILIFSVDFIFNNILQPHHQNRIESLLGITNDPHGAGYNVNQSKIAIGSGGAFGKGFLEGTQTKFRFVPEQSTDFIFCTISEEMGFIGSSIVLLIYFLLIIRLINLAEKQTNPFARIYGYCVATCMFMHVLINIGMTIGVMPVVGIPLPFISYGGTSLLSFTILLFIFVRFEIERKRD